MSEIKNVGETWMALNNFKCNHLMSLHFKGLMINARLDTHVQISHTNNILSLTVYCAETIEMTIESPPI